MGHMLLNLSKNVHRESFGEGHWDWDYMHEIKIEPDYKSMFIELNAPPSNLSSWENLRYSLYILLIYKSGCSQNASLNPNVVAECDCIEIVIRNPTPPKTEKPIWEYVLG